MSKFNELVTKLREVFQIDRPELDFGVYRILNARADEINEYLEKRLKEKVEQALASGNAANIDQLNDDLKKAEQAASDAGFDPAESPKVKELKAKITQASSGSAEHENAVFSHLLTFFSRYYDNGDFISQRRYKGDTYAIPYAGEEVMLHWANKDQYYIKSGENFSNYSFKLQDGRVVHFRLIAADTAKDNRKDNDKERRFVLAEYKILTRIDDDGEEYEEQILPVEEVTKTDAEGKETKELIIRFEYKAMPKGSKQDKLVEAAVNAVLADGAVASRWLDLSKREPTEKNPKRTLLEKQLTNYTTKNTADYFIHKNLGKFLRGELDFYIKNEVMHLDDVQNAEAFSNIEKNLRMIQCLRSIALDLIKFLAQLEDFQKKLWTKKKFVVSSHYCITLDQVPNELFTEILANEKQWSYWKSLGLWEKSSPGTIDDLNRNMHFIVDSALFSKSFQYKVASLISDDTVDGILINSDNYHAVNFIETRFSASIKAIYIDPPYNTDSSEIAYKNGYRSSSWSSLLHSRIDASKRLLSEDGILCATIDDEQQKELSYILDETFGKPNHLGTVPIRINPSGRITLRGFAQCHEYGIFYGNSQSSAIGKLPRTDAQQSRFNQSDEKGVFEWRNFRREGSSSDRTSRPKRFFPLFVKDDSFRIPDMNWRNELNGYELLEEASDGEVVMYPIDSNGTERVWRWGVERILKEQDEIVPKVNQRGELQVYYKYRPNEDGVLPQTIWNDKKFSATEYGTAMLKNLFGGRNEFTFPKSLHAVED
ncbi:DNA methyltransferase [Thalassolituus oleivorans]|uniref:DNA methyltransferase n=1 Tax=Thalassolituus oleivorans TaxID=187493 RepID=UPI0021F08511|nr:DNA methyltransferase [Thalassolituus oleivorans]